MLRFNKKYLLSVLTVIALAAVLIFWPQSESNKRYATVQNGFFQTSVKEVGNLKAVVAQEILAPHATIAEGKYLPPMEIIELVSEGTMVKKGDQVAVLDPSQVDAMNNQISQRTFEIQQRIEQSKIDSSITLADFRNAITNARDQLENAKLKRDQSIYESKSVIRQAEIDYEKAMRNLDKEMRNYDQKRRALVAQIDRESKYFNKYMKEVEGILQLKQQTVINAPSDGMVVYTEQFGVKKEIGSRVNGWQPVIATLPDLRYMQSVIMVPETSIAKIKIGQEVNITVEAIPGKTFTGKVKKIANIGNKISNKQQVAFEVCVDIDVPEVTDDNYELLPNMTSNNEIITNSWNNTLFVKKEAVINADSVSFVLKKTATSYIKQQVIVNGENEYFYRITAGLNEKDKLLLEFPSNYAQKKLTEI